MTTVSLRLISFLSCTIPFSLQYTYYITFKYDHLRQKYFMFFDDIVYNITLRRDLISWIIRSTVWNMYCIVLLYKVKVFIEHGLNKFSFTTSKGEWWLLVDHNSKYIQNSKTHIFNSTTIAIIYKTVWKYKINNV